VKFPEVIDQLVQRIAAANGVRSEPVVVESAAAKELVHTQPDDRPAAEVARPKADVTPTEPPVSAELVLANPTLERATAAAESMNLGLHLGAAVMRIADAANKGSEGATELREAVWLIERYIELLDVRPLGADINAEQRRMARIEETLERLRAMSAAMSAQPAESALPPASPLLTEPPLPAKPPLPAESTPPAASSLPAESAPPAEPPLLPESAPPAESPLLAERAPPVESPLLAEVERAPEQGYPDADETAIPPASDQPSLRHKITFMAARWVVIVVSVILVVLAVALIAVLR
jgi:hypothetical protein